MPSPDLDALWKYIAIESPYTKWGFWPDHQGMQPGRALHGPLHKVYVNDRALNSPQPPIQYGSFEAEGSLQLETACSFRHNSIGNMANWKGLVLCELPALSPTISCIRKHSRGTLSIFKR